MLGFIRKAVPVSGHSDARLEQFLQVAKAYLLDNDFALRFDRYVERSKDGPLKNNGSSGNGSAPAVAIGLRPGYDAEGRIILDSADPAYDSDAAYRHQLQMEKEYFGKPL